jgi:hypothetical protein
MAITILKNSAKAKAKPKTEALSGLAVLIDEVGALSVDALPKLLKIKKLQEELKAYLAKVKVLNGMIDAIESYDADVEFTEKGELFEVSAGPRAKNREIPDAAALKAIKKKLGDDTFFNIAKVTLGDLDKYISEAEQSKLGVVKKTRGTRKIEVKALPR